MTKPELQELLSEMTTCSLQLLEELYIEHKSKTAEELRNIRVKELGDMRLSDFICMVINILSPAYNIALKEWPEAQELIDWAQKTYGYFTM